MRLYTSKGVANGRKVRAVASHLDIDLELVWLDFQDGDVFSEDYAKINPTQRIPALEIGDFLLWESTAIIKYFCALRPGNSLYPDDIRLRADIDRWLSWDLAHYNQHYSLIALESVVKPKLLGLPADVAIINWAIPRLTADARILDAHLKGRTYIAGECLTLADYAIGASEFFQRLLPIDWSALPYLDAYYDRMRAEPHLARTAVAPDEMGRRPDDAEPFRASIDREAPARRFDHSRS